MAIKFRYNNANYSLNEQTSAIAENNLVYYSGGAKKYCPASSERGSSVTIPLANGKKAKINNSSPSICFKKNDIIYYAAKSLSVIQPTYVPVVKQGTYTGYELYTLISSYFPSTGGTRFVLTVDGYGDRTNIFAYRWQYAQSKYSVAGLLKLELKTKNATSNNNSYTTLDKFILYGCTGYQDLYPSNYWSTSVQIVSSKELGVHDSITFLEDFDLG